MVPVWQAQNIGNADLIFCLQVREKNIAVTAAAMDSDGDVFRKGFLPPKVMKGSRRKKLNLSDAVQATIKIIGISLEKTDTAPIWCAVKKVTAAGEEILPAYDGGTRLNDPAQGQDSWVKVMDAPALKGNETYKIVKTLVRLQ